MQRIRSRLTGFMVRQKRDLGDNFFCVHFLICSQYPAIESAINNLNHRGLDRIRTQGEDGFFRTVALSVVAANVHRLGQITKQQLRKRQQWYQARRKAA